MADSKKSTQSTKQPRFEIKITKGIEMTQREFFHTKDIPQEVKSAIRGSTSFIEMDVGNSHYEVRIYR